MQNKDSKWNNFLNLAHIISIIVSIIITAIISYFGYLNKVKEIEFNYNLEIKKLNQAKEKFSKLFIHIIIYPPLVLKVLFLFHELLK